MMTLMGTIYRFKQRATEAGKIPAFLCAKKSPGGNGGFHAMTINAVWGDKTTA